MDKEPKTTGLLTDEEWEAYRIEDRKEWAEYVKRTTLTDEQKLEEQKRIRKVKRDEAVHSVLELAGSILFLIFFIFCIMAIGDAVRGEPMPEEMRVD